MGGYAPGDHAPLKIFSDGKFGEGHESIQQDRHARSGGSNEEADARGKISRTKRRQPLHRVRDPMLGAGQGDGDYSGLVCQVLVVEPRTAPGYLLGTDSEGGGHQRGGRSRVADPQVAQDQQVGTGGDLVGRDPLSDPESTADLVDAQRVFAVDQSRRPPYVVRAHFRRDLVEVVVDADVEHPERHTVLSSQHAGTGLSGHENANHGRGHLAGIGRYPEMRNPVITGKHHSADTLDRSWWADTLAGRQPRGGRFKLAKGAGGFGELGQPSKRSLVGRTQWRIDHRSAAFSGGLTAGVGRRSSREVSSVRPAPSTAHSTSPVPKLASRN